MEKAGIQPAAVPRITLLAIGITLLAWLTMQAVHEAGHVLGAWATGHQIVRVTLHPLRISETVVTPRPAPLLQVWGGPFTGCALPLFVWGLSRLTRSRWSSCWQFFAGFCLIANGAYLGAGLWEPVGDAQDLLQLGSPPWQLGLFGLVTILAGLGVWDRLPPDLRSVQIQHYASWYRVLIIWGVLAVVVTVELAYSTTQTG